MPKKKYLVTLTESERAALEQLLRSGVTATRKVTRARILLKAAEGWDDQPIANASTSDVPRSNARASGLSRRTSPP